MECGSMSCNTAVFYDVENLISLFNSKINRTLQLDEIHRRILDLEVVKGISIQRAYADWMLQINRNLQSYVLQIGIEPVQIFNTNHHDRVKNAADVSLIIDAVELLAKHPEIENYVIASGDGIFAFLAKKLHAYGKRVIGCGFDRNTNNIFKNACDIFLTLEKNDQSLSALVKNLNRGTIFSASAISSPPAPPVAPAPPVEVVKPKVTLPSFVPTETKIDQKMLAKLPKNKYTEALIAANIPVWRNSRDLSGSLHLIKHMINVLFEVVETDLENSLFKAYIDYYLPTFRSGYYGFKRFGEFMRFVVTASPYCLILSDGTVLRITRRNSENEKHKDRIEDFPNLLFTLKDESKVRSLFDIEEGVPFTFTFEDYEDDKLNIENELNDAVELIPENKLNDAVELIPENKLNDAVELPPENKLNDAVELIPENKLNDTVELIPENKLNDTVELIPENEINVNDESEILAVEESHSNVTEQEVTKTVAKKAPAKKAPAKKASVKKTPAKKAATKKVTSEEAVPINTNLIPNVESEDYSTKESPAEGASTEGSARKKIRNALIRLSHGDSIPTREVKRLLNENYCQKTFSVTVPIFKEVAEDVDMREQRMIDGKIKYWKDAFKFNGKSYLVFQEWVAKAHLAKFESWLKKIDK